MKRALLLLCSLIALTSAFAMIKVGTSLSLSGPIETLARNLQLGVQIYFDKVNAQGGVHGQKLQLITLDNQYDPLVAGQNVRRLINQDQVIALIANNGSALAMITVPIANEKKTLLFGAYPGTDILHKTPPDRYVINLRASYAEEAAAMIRGLLSAGIQPKEIAFFAQNDAFGYSIYQGGLKALKAAGYPRPEKLPYGVYTRGTSNIEDALAKIVQEAANVAPKAIIMAGDYAPNAAFIQLASKKFPHTIFMVASGLIHARDIDKRMDGRLILIQALPPLESGLPAMREYRQDLKKYAKSAQPSDAGLSGYLAAKLFVMGLQQAQAQEKLNREGIIDVFEEMRNVNLGIGMKINFDKDHHTALHTVWPTIFHQGKFLPLSWSEMKKYVQ